MTASRPPDVTPGDEAAFRALFEAAYDDLLCFVERRTHPLAAEDVVAEVFLTAWRRLDDVPPGLDQARAWLFTVAHHLLRNHRRGDHRRQAVALRILREPGSTVAEPADVAGRVDLSRAWDRLSPGDQQVLSLTAVEDLTGPQAARVLGISATAFSLRLLRARRRLRKFLTGEPAEFLTGEPAEFLTGEPAEAAPTTTEPGAPA
ncbi:sigma-70 family RNA polymerase sigma factor [Amorphoplanes nipponensis]|uniref:DNA-directed RNA polymerase sigma-70 factor n=1 Tax=Actinoplanes nipponensis TaxID=135950 RepID=A0A919JCF7_9ACTN|nr:RNA polymerase sigma factor [Actinoplanes nipponensis]GIE46815.1 DNA-directed RNA polymerase sigma-70 factor [Actinoplanes nipponensis]